MKLGVEVASNIKKVACEQLKKRALGGVSVESAQSAIDMAIKDTLEIGQKAVDDVQRQLNNANSEVSSYKEQFWAQKKGYTDVIIQKDNIIAQKEKVVDGLKSIIKKVTTPKKFEKVLDNGNKEIRKVNNNGATMVREVSPNGINLRTEITLLDGSYRKTINNPTNGNPMKTYTNVNGDKLIEYNDMGVSISQKAVNVKKVNPNKLQMVKQEVLEESYWAAKIKRSYSDGSFEMIDYSKTRNSPVFISKYDVNKKMLSRSEYSFSNDKVSAIKTNCFDSETSNICKSIVKTDKFEATTFYAKNGVDIEGKNIRYANGHKKTLKLGVNEFGFKHKFVKNVKHTYPKSSPVKSSNIYFSGMYDPSLETLKMKNGNIVELSKFDGYYRPCQMEITTPKGETTVLKGSREVGEKLNELGIVKYKEDGNIAEYYYSNTLA